MNKRSALSGYMVGYIVKLVFLIVLVVTTLFLISTYVKKEVDSFSAETSLFVTGLLYSKNGISLVDQNSGTVMPGIIDLRKISSADLSESLKIADSRHIAARIIISDMGGNVISTLYFNKPWFDNYFVVAAFKGLSAARMSERRLYVLLSDEAAYDLLRVKNSLEEGLPEAEENTKRLLDKMALEKNPRLVQGYLKITVVMPNS